MSCGPTPNSPGDALTAGKARHQFSSQRLSPQSDTYSRRAVTKMRLGSTYLCLIRPCRVTMETPQSNRKLAVPPSPVGCGQREGRSMSRPGEHVTNSRSVGGQAGPRQTKQPLAPVSFPEEIQPHCSLGTHPALQSGGHGAGEGLDLRAPFPNLVGVTWPLPGKFCCPQPPTPSPASGLGHRLLAGHQPQLRWTEGEGLQTKDPPQGAETSLGRDPVWILPLWAPCHGHRGPAPRRSVMPTHAMEPEAAWGTSAVWVMRKPRQSRSAWMRKDWNSISVSEPSSQPLGPGPVGSDSPRWGAEGAWGKRARSRRGQMQVGTVHARAPCPGSLPVHAKDTGPSHYCVRPGCTALFSGSSLPLSSLS